jgi:hypothetical protein
MEKETFNSLEFDDFIETIQSRNFAKIERLAKNIQNYFISDCFKTLINDLKKGYNNLTNDTIKKYKKFIQDNEKESKKNAEKEAEIYNLNLQIRQEENKLKNKFLQQRIDEIFLNSICSYDTMCQLLTISIGVSSDIDINKFCYNEYNDNEETSYLYLLFSKIENVYISPERYINSIIKIINNSITDVNLGKFPNFPFIIALQLYNKDITTPLQLIEDRLKLTNKKGHFNALIQQFPDFIHSDINIQWVKFYIKDIDVIYQDETPLTFLLKYIRNYNHDKKIFYSDLYYQYVIDIAYLLKNFKLDCNKINTKGESPKQLWNELLIYNFSSDQTNEDQKVIIDLVSKQFKESNCK